MDTAKLESLLVRLETAVAKLEGRGGAAAPAAGGDSSADAASTRCSSFLLSFFRAISVRPSLITQHGWTRRSSPSSTHQLPSETTSQKWAPLFKKSSTRRRPSSSLPQNIPNPPTVTSKRSSNRRSKQLLA